MRFLSETLCLCQWLGFVFFHQENFYKKQPHRKVLQNGHVTLGNLRVARKALISQLEIAFQNAIKKQGQCWRGQPIPMQLGQAAS